MNKLYILGNGFDLEHDIHSTESDYIKYPDMNKKSFKNWHHILLNSLKYTYERKTRNGEYLLPSIDISHVDSIKDIVCILEKCEKTNHLDWTGLENNIECDWPAPSFPHNLVNEIIAEKQSSIFLWLKDKCSVPKTLSTNIKIRKFDNNDFFVTFNYSLTLEHIYGINHNNILHIHGSIIDKNTIQFGNDYTNNQHINIDDPSSLIYSKDSTRNKEKVEKFIDNALLNNVNEIHIYGWRAQCNSKTMANGAFGSSGGDVSISGLIWTKYLQTKKIRTFIYRYPNFQDSNNGLKWTSWLNVSHKSYLMFKD